MPTPPRHADKGNRKLVLNLPQQGQTTIYSNQKVLNALAEIQEDLTLYKGVRLLQVIEAAYVQGQKDGMTAALDETDAQMAQLQQEIQKMRPKKIGRPPKRKAVAPVRRRASST